MKINENIYVVPNPLIFHGALHLRLLKSQKKGGKAKKYLRINQVKNSKIIKHIYHKKK